MDGGHRLPHLNRLAVIVSYWGSSSIVTSPSTCTSKHYPAASKRVHTHKGFAIGFLNHDGDGPVMPEGRAAPTARLDISSIGQGGLSANGFADFQIPYHV